MRIVAQRKWTFESVGQWIDDAARRIIEDEERLTWPERLRDMDRLAALDSVELQSLGTRLGRLAWEGRSTRPLLDMALEMIVREQARGESLAVAPRSWLGAAGALVTAMMTADEPLSEPADPGRLMRLTEKILRGRAEPRLDVTPGLVRSLIEPLLAADRSGFRSVVGTVSEALIRLESAALDGRIEGLLQLPLYWNLKALQWMLNGLLFASRARIGARDAAITVSA